MSSHTDWMDAMIEEWKRNNPQKDRVYLAGAALTGLLANELSLTWTAETVGTLAAEIADATIAALRKSQ